MFLRCFSVALLSFYVWWHLFWSFSSTVIEDGADYYSCKGVVCYSKLLVCGSWEAVSADLWFMNICVIICFLIFMSFYSLWVFVPAIRFIAVYANILHKSWVFVLEWIKNDGFLVDDSRVRVSTTLFVTGGHGMFIFLSISFYCCMSSLILYTS